jgi:hypothetical protein
MNILINSRHNLMNRSTFFLTLFVIIGQLSFAQEINIYKTFGGYRFERDSVSISPKMVLEIMEVNPQAYAEFKRAKSNYATAGVLGAVGGFMIGFPIGTAVVGGDPEWGLAAGGLGLILVSIPFTSAFRNHALNALDTYNSSLSSSKRVKINFFLAGAGGKLVIKF